MFRFLGIFWIFIVFYHLFVTIIIYWFLWGSYAEFPAILRDGIRIVLFLIIFLFNIKYLKKYLLNWKYPWIVFIIMIIWGIVVSLLKDKTLFDMFIWIKYWFFYMLILLTASFIWFIKKEIDSWKLVINRNLKIIWYWLIGIMIVWFIWQWAKLLWPDFFMNIWYWPLNDFFFGENPPIYYLTWFKWTLRRQGIFSGPNNYWYFLVAFLPLILLINKYRRFFKNSKYNEYCKYWIIWLWILAILFTLSRTAILWSAIVFIVINLERIRKNKLKSWIILFLWLISIVWLSFLKDSSTLNHIVAKFGSLKYVIDNPIWMGLGTAWPAIHHNWSILPENYFLQVMLDIWTIWFIIWAFFWYLIININKKIRGNLKEYKKNTDYILWRYLNISLFCLMFMWLFLHVFEDSMVNYLFFVTYWIFIWYFSNNKE